MINIKINNIYTISISIITAYIVACIPYSYTYIPYKTAHVYHYMYYTYTYTYLA